MKLAVVGFGNAGSKIADRLLAYEADTNRTLCRSVLAVNSATIDLRKLEQVPQDRQILIGETDERVQGHGAGADPEVGADIARRDYREIERKLDAVPIHDVDAFLIVAGLGGGTGSGGAPVLASNLRDIYDEPVYGLGILPSADEGGRSALNAARSLRSFAEATDNLLLFDNDAWREDGDTLAAGYERTNHEIVTRVGTLLAAGEYDDSTVSETAMDASDVKRTLATGGVSSIAYAEAALEEPTRNRQGLLGRFTDGEHAAVDDETTTKKINGLVKQAVRSRLTCPADVESAERSLIVVSGPQREFSKKGLERARRWVERQTDSVEVLAGDDPREAASSLSAVVLLSNPTDVPRIDELQERAVDAKRNIERQASSRQREIQELLTDDEDELDPL
ncbi:MAG: tubulin/FtsZ family protein [Haloarculaceae archaeon]